eukprot:TRINITY_DN101962_c0_g1_i1.p1 TRINITY_DN101962_c0_g1~~TRINITY_DN101962_c0_g1_i1.p1  ORF type:complete len:406 (+),score=78.70 TRINITY_DN101962_c0_g1_i1:119-1336(+)
MALTAVSSLEPPSGRSTPQMVRWRVARGFSGRSAEAYLGSPGGRRPGENGGGVKTWSASSSPHPRIAKLEQEMHDVRQAYAKKLAATELECEAKLREGEDEKEKWYKRQKNDLAECRAACVIMKAMFDSQKLKMNESRRDAEEKFELDRAVHMQEMKRVEEKCKATVDALVADHAKKTKQFEDHIDKAEKEKVQLQNRNALLQDELAQEKDVSRKLRDECEKQKIQVQELNQQVVALKNEDTLASKTARIEELEAELKKTRRVMQKQFEDEANALKRELMDYVKFIVRILPDGWQEQPSYSWVVPKQLRGEAPFSGLLHGNRSPDNRPATSPVVGRPPSRGEKSGLPRVGVGAWNSLPQRSGTDLSDSSQPVAHRNWTTGDVAGAFGHNGRTPRQVPFSSFVQMK